MIAHTPAEAVVENEVPATCTAKGSYDSVVYCSVCHTELSRETIEIPATGHNWKEPKWFWSENHTSAIAKFTCSVCGENHIVETPNITSETTYPTGNTEGKIVYTATVEFDGETYIGKDIVVIPAINSEPIETSNLNIYSSISVGTDMVITFNARKSDLANYQNFWIVIVKHDPEGDKTYTYEQDALSDLNPDGSTASTWKVQFKDIYAKEMGVEIEARVYAKNAYGQVYMSKTRNATIRDELENILKNSNNEAQKKLAADMLNYGAAAQMFMDFQTDHLVTDEISDDAKDKLAEYATTELPMVEKTNSNYRPEGQSNILFTSVTLGNEVLLNLTVRLTQETEGVQVLVKDHDTGAVVTTLDTVFLGSTFSAAFNGIGADKMRTEYDLVTLVNGVETGNIRTWSVEAYVGEIRAEGIAPKVAMANALLTYGDSAAAYFQAR